MDRASDSGSEGWGFESLPVYQKMQIPSRVSAFFAARKGLERLNANVRWTFAGWVGPQPHLTIYFPKEINWQRVPSGVRQTKFGNNGVSLFRHGFAVPPSSKGKALGLARLRLTRNCTDPYCIKHKKLPVFLQTCRIDEYFDQ